MKNNELIGSVDASIWAKEFVRIVKKNPKVATDEGCMIGWFANAIMAGYDYNHSNDKILLSRYLWIQNTWKGKLIRYLLK